MIMHKTRIKKTEWDQQAVSAQDLCRQVCRTIDQDEFQRVVDDVKDKLQLPGKLSAILDVGCGNGLLLSKFTNHFDNLYGVDFSPNMIEQARTIVRHGHFCIGNANDLKFGNGQFDRVMAYSIFHYFPDFDYAATVVLEMIRVSKKGGLILIGDILDHAFENKIKGGSDLDYEKKIPLIQRYSEWKFFDLKKFARLFGNNVHSVEILSQPENFKCAYYRKDLRIRV